MTSLLHIEASASHPEMSVCRQLSALFADTWRGAHGGAGYRCRDLATNPVPPITGAYVSLGRRVERQGASMLTDVANHTEDDDERREWDLTLPLITELLAADTVLVGNPMYNFSIPASLKAWIDRVTFPGAFIDPDSGHSLMRDTRVVVVTARGGSYSPGTPREAFDFQMPYLRAYFGNLGVAEVNIHFVHAEMTLANIAPGLADFKALADASLDAARAAITALAAQPDPAQPVRADAGVPGC